MYKLTLALTLTTVVCNMAKADFYLGAQAGGGFESGKTTILVDETDIERNKVDGSSQVNKMAGVFMGYDRTQPSGLYISLEISILPRKLDHNFVLSKNDLQEETLEIKSYSLNDISWQFGYAFKNNIISFITLGGALSKYELKRDDGGYDGIMHVFTPGFGIKYKFHPWLVTLKYNYLFTHEIKETRPDPSFKISNIPSYKFSEHIVTFGFGYSF